MGSLQSWEALSSSGVLQDSLAEPGPLSTGEGHGARDASVTCPDAGPAETVTRLELCVVFTVHCAFHEPPSAPFLRQHGHSGQNGQLRLRSFTIKGESWFSCSDGTREWTYSANSPRVAEWDTRGCAAWVPRGMDGSSWMYSYKQQSARSPCVLGGSRSVMVTGLPLSAVTTRSPGAEARPRFLSNGVQSPPLSLRHWAQ